VVARLSKVEPLHNGPAADVPSRRDHFPLLPLLVDDREHGAPEGRALQRDQSMLTLRLAHADAY
jgi:hypothetical protein